MRCLLNCPQRRSRTQLTGKGTIRKPVPGSTSVERRLRKYVKDGQAFKEWLRVEAETYYNMLKDYGELKRDEQLGFTVNSETFRIQVKGNRVKRFDERADIAVKRLMDYLDSWIRESGNGEGNPLYKLAMSLLQRNEYGDLDYDHVYFPAL